MAVRHEGVCEFERRFPQGLLCKTMDIPEGYGSVYLITNLSQKCRKKTKGEKGK